MGLLCPQQIAQQTGRPGDGFTAFASHGLLTFEGYSSELNMISKADYQ
jgi:hypothetical protein